MNPRILIVLSLALMSTVDCNQGGAGIRGPRVRLSGDTDAILKMLNESLVVVKKEEDTRHNKSTLLEKKIENGVENIQKSQKRLVKFNERMLKSLENMAKDFDRMERRAKASVFCKKPWHLLGGGICVASRNANVTWSEAESTCRSIGARLMTFRDAEEVASVISFMKAHRTDHLWVGHRYNGYTPVSLAGPSAYNPPRSLYWRGDHTYISECAVVNDDKELYTQPCDMRHNSICRRLE